jgi:hypothetical protein
MTLENITDRAIAEFRSHYASEYRPSEHEARTLLTPDNRTELYKIPAGHIGARQYAGATKGSLMIIPNDAIIEEVRDAVHPAKSDDYRKHYVGCAACIRAAEKRLGWK